MQRASITAAGFGILRNVEGCVPVASTPAGQAPSPAPELIPGTFAELRDKYFVYHLDRNPVTSTYLGGDGYSPVLADTNTRFRDYRQASLDAELRMYRSLRSSLAAIALTQIATV